MPQQNQSSSQENKTYVSDHKCTGNPLEGYLSRAALARLIGKSERTIQRWNSLREGPPLVRIGQTAYYREQAVREWLLSREQQPVRSRR